MTGNGSKKKIIIIALILILIMGAVIGIVLWRNGLRATTMRVLRIEGVVNLQDNGSFKAVKENLRLKSGNALDTATDSLVSIGLDDVKIVTLDQLSRAEFNQQGKYLNLELTKGSLFFEVDKPLADDETFEIETSTMIVGIRGTSGWVSVEGGIESLIITDGHVHVIGTNPVTGEVKETDVCAGQRLRVYLYNDRKVDSIMFELEYITERELPEFVLRMLRENPALLDKVCAETGWDKPWILGIRDEEPESEPEPEPGTSGDASGSGTGTKPDTEPVTDAGDVGGNNENDTDLNPANVNPVVEKPAPSVLEVMIAEARKHIVKENEDGTCIIDEGRLFDGVYYANRYPDVAEAFGTERDALLAHYEIIGKLENRFTSKEEEDAKILADAIANQPKEDPNANQTATNTTPVVTWNNPSGNLSATYTICGSYGNQQAGLADNQFVMYDGSTGTFDGTTFTVSTVPGQVYTLELPTTVFYDGQDYTLNPSNVVINSSDVDTVNATNTNPSAKQLVDIVKNNSTNNTYTLNATSSNLGTVGYEVEIGWANHATSGISLKPVASLNLIDLFNLADGMSNSGLDGIYLLSTSNSNGFFRPTGTGNNKVYNFYFGSIRVWDVKFSNISATQADIDSGTRQYWSGGNPSPGSSPESIVNNPPQSSDYTYMNTSGFH